MAYVEGLLSHFRELCMVCEQDTVKTKHSLKLSATENMDNATNQDRQVQGAKTRAPVENMTFATELSVLLQH